MKHKKFLLFAALMLSIFLVSVNIYSQPGCQVTFTFYEDGVNCSEPVGEDLPIHFWAGGFSVDDFYLYTDENGQITHNFTYCNDTYYLEETAIDCVPGGCINYFVPQHIANSNIPLPYKCRSDNECTCTTEKPGYFKGESMLPIHYFLYQNYPNPFNPSTNIKFDLPKDSYVKFIVYDVSGKEVITLVDGMNTAGKHNIDFNGSDLPSGVYFFKLETTDYSNTRKMVLIK